MTDEGEATMKDEYHGSTTAELRRVGGLQRLRSLANQATLFAHSGRIELRDGILELGDWMTLTPGDMASVTQEFVPEYGRFTAGGARGGFPSVGALGRIGMPIVIDLVSGERLVLIIGSRPLSGRTLSSEWYPALRDFANGDQQH